MRKSFLIILLLAPFADMFAASAGYQQNAVQDWYNYLNNSIAAFNKYSADSWAWNQSERKRLGEWYQSEARRGVDANSLNNMYQAEVRKVDAAYSSGIQKAEADLLQAKKAFNQAMVSMGLPQQQVPVQMAQDPFSRRNTESSPGSGQQISDSSELERAQKDYAKWSQEYQAQINCQPGSSCYNPGRAEQLADLMNDAKKRVDEYSKKVAQKKNPVTPKDCKECDCKAPGYMALGCSLCCM